MLTEGTGETSIDVVKIYVVVVLLLVIVAFGKALVKLLENTEDNPADGVVFVYIALVADDENADEE